MLQPYKLFTIPITNGIVCNVHYDTNTINLEIKQTKEDMEEKKLNLKPFDIQKAKEGKPVCTRDGRKARIICFDTKGDVCPIIALVEENGIEAAYHYDKEGRNAYNKSELDLMMLYEKKEGYINVYSTMIYDTLEDADKAMRDINSSYYIQTLKVEWEE